MVISLAIFIAVYALEAAIVAIIGVFLGKLICKLFSIELNIAIAVVFVSSSIVVVFHKLSDISLEIGEIKADLLKYFERKRDAHR